MKTVIKIALVMVCGALLSLFAFNEKKVILTGDTAIIPKVNTIDIKEAAYFLIEEKLIISTENESQVELIKQFEKTFQLKGKIQTSIVQNSGEGDIRLFTNNLLDIEEYKLSVNYTGIKIEAATNKGFYYGLQTLRQMYPLLPSSIESDKITIQIPHVEIEDKPRFKWRGMMLDVARHFYTVDEIKEVLDQLSLLKINTFHWHLVDDQGWRIEIKKYPELINIGAWRVNQEDVLWNDRVTNKVGSKADFGDFYTQEQIKEVVAYAAEKQITVVPEVELPAHVMSAIASYPELSCSSQKIEVPSGGVWPITEIYCPGKENTFTFIENVLEEITVLFPSKYIHIGGDEATKTNWKSCNHCQKRIKDENLHDEEELQSYMVKRIAKFIKNKGKIMIGWDEIMEGGLAEDAVVMSWRGMKGGIEAAKQKHQVIMSPDTYVYLDHYQGNKKYEPYAIGGYSPLQHVYNFDPVPNELSEEEKTYILGGQANVWTEYIDNKKHLQYMLFPRMLAVAEDLWTLPQNKEWNDFSVRVRAMFEYFDDNGINYSRSSYNLRSTKMMNPQTGNLELKIYNEYEDTEVRYTLNGDQPTLKSPKLEGNITITDSVMVIAQVFEKGKPVGHLFQEEINPVINKAKGAKVAYNVDYSPKYSSGNEFGLVDGIIGSTAFDDRNWQGWFNEELELIIDLGDHKQVDSIVMDFLVDRGNQILMPSDISISLSDNGETFGEPKQLNFPETLTKEIFKQHINTEIHSKTRFLKINVANATNEKTGEKGWTFMDEIIVM